MFKKNTKPVVKIDQSFITYDGFNQELNMLLKSGKYIKPFEVAVGVYSPDLPKRILAEHTQIVVMNGKIYILYAVKAATPEEAVVEFNKIKANKPIREITILKWFNLLTAFTGREPLTKIPEETKKKKKSVISEVLPYNVKSSQKQIDISGQVGRTLLLTGFPSKIFPGFCSELVELSDKVIVSIHLNEIDIEKCLVGLPKLDVRPMRKTVMKDFLEKERKEERGIYDTAVFVYYRGEQEEVDAFVEKLNRFLDKYLVGKSDLDYQQRRAAMSILPLCHNEVQYNRVLGLSDISAILPISRLRDAKKMKSAVPYGKDYIQGNIAYSRLLNKENGAILSTDAAWCVERAKEEIDTYKKYAEAIVVVADQDTDTNMFVPDGMNESEQVLSLDKTSDFMKQALVARWAFNTMAINGSLSIRKLNILKTAVPKIQGENYLEDFINAITDKDVKRTLSLNPCPRKFYYKAYENENICVLKVQGDKEIEREMGYALVMNELPKNIMLYSLNTELLVNEFPQFQIKDDIIYTFLVGTSQTPGFLSDGPTGNVDHVYDDPTIKQYIGSSMFLYVGEHKIAEKLKLNLANPMSKEQREVITAPAKGHLLITKEVSYILEV